MNHLAKFTSAGDLAVTIQCNELLPEEQKTAFLNEGYELIAEEVFQQLRAKTHYKNPVTGAIEPVPLPSIEDIRSNKLRELGAAFATARDAITWHDFNGVVYGYDRHTEDITNFLAARARAKAGVPIPYKVYVGAIDVKQIVPHTAEMFDVILEQSAQEQITAYAKYENYKAQVLAAETVTDVMAIQWEQ